MSIQFDPTGVQPGQIGPVYDLGLGYFDPTTNMVKMFGYVVSPSGGTDEGTDITDAQHIVSTASPNSTDRYARYPQVSQGDWSGGERQVVYTEPSMYYQTDGGMDVTTPGRLKLLNAFGRAGIFYNLTGTYNHCPMQTDGAQIWIGASTAGHNIIYYTDAGGFSFQNLFNGHEVADMLYDNIGLVFMTDQGLWYEDGSHFVNQALPSPFLATKSLAYLNDEVFYIVNDTGALDSTIWAYNGTANAHTLRLTANTTERYFQCICSMPDAIFFATTSNLPVISFLYTWSGASGDLPVRIAEIKGRIEYCFEALGTVYVLVRGFGANGNNPAWTLYSVVGNQVSVVDDARYINDANFTPTCTSVESFDPGHTTTTAEFNSMLWTDGRFLYIAWPGLATRRLDLVNGGLSTIGPNGTNNAANVSARRFITATSPPYMDVCAYDGGISLTPFYLGTSQPRSGTLTYSFADFGSPGVGKVFRSVEFQLADALVAGQGITWQYRLTQDGAFAALNVVQMGPRNYVAFFPPGTKGTEVQVMVSMTAITNVSSPVLRYSSIVADVGKAWQWTVACRRNMQSRSEDGAAVDQGPYTGQQLAANIVNIREIAAGRCYLYIPDVTQASGVAQVQARLVDYHRTTPNGAAAGRRQVGGELDVECDVQISLVEEFAFV